MKYRTIIIVILFFLSMMHLTAQEKQNKNIIGIDVLDLPSSTLSLKYQFSNNPRYYLNINGGFTLNYANNVDIIGYMTSFGQFTDDANALYEKDIENGMFLKFGGQFNFRKSFDENYFYIGAYQTNSWIYEKGKQGYYTEDDISYKDVEHNKYLTGIAMTLGYNFRVRKKLQFDFGLQLSKQFNDNGNLFGHENHIPGVGFHAYNTGDEIFKRFYFNISYELGRLN